MRIFSLSRNLSRLDNGDFIIFAIINIACFRRINFFRVRIRDACLIALIITYKRFKTFNRRDVFLSYRFRCAGLVGTISNKVTYIWKNIF